MFKPYRNVRSRRAFILIAFCFMLPMGSSGRIREHSWTFQEMFDKADLVLIGRLVSTKDTNERNVLLGNIKVVGVITEFAPRLILKGPKSIRAIQLHHYRLENPDDEGITDGPNLVYFGRPASAYLLFVVREKTGNYAPVEDQTDPGDGSVIPLLSLDE